MHESTITVKVGLDENRVPQSIGWQASDTTVDKDQKAKAMMLSFWDGTEKTALRIDLWTADMMVDEMADFFYQTMMSMADTYERATRQTETVQEMKDFAREFYRKFQEQLEKQNSGK